MAYVALFIALDIVLYFICIFFQCMPASMAVCVFCVNIDIRKSQRLGEKKVCFNVYRIQVTTNCKK